MKTKVIVRVVAPHLEPGSATHISIDSLFTREFKILFRTKAGTLLYRAISPLDLKKNIIQRPIIQDLTLLERFGPRRIIQAPP